MGAGASVDSVTNEASALEANFTAEQIAEYLAPLKSKLPDPETPKYKLAVVGFRAPGGYEMNTDKDKTWVRYDSTAIANGVTRAGASCDLIDYTADDHDGFAAKVEAYDGLIVRINPGQLSAPGVAEGAQKRFDELMMSLVGKGKPVWSSPAAETELDAKDALVMMKGEFNCSCVGISQFEAACGPDKDLNDVPTDKFIEGTVLVDLIGKKAVETLDEMKAAAAPAAEEAAAAPAAAE